MNFIIKKIALASILIGTATIVQASNPAKTTGFHQVIENFGSKTPSFSEVEDGFTQPCL